MTLFNTYSTASSILPHFIRCVFEAKYKTEEAKQNENKTKFAVHSNISINTNESKPFSNKIEFSYLHKFTKNTGNPRIVRFFGPQQTALFEKPH